MKRSRRLAGFASLCLLAGLAASAQEPSCPCPPVPPVQVWKGGLGAGLALTSGNTDTSSFNLSFDAVRDPKTSTILRFDGRYLRASDQGEATLDRTLAGARVEREISPRAFAFGEGRYQRDVFKDVEYLISPLAGLGLKLVDKERTTLSLDAALGGSFEKLREREATSSGALQATQSFSRKLSATATLTEKGAALWKLDDFGDANYRLEAALAASISKWAELKLGYALDYKSRPADAALERADSSITAAIVFTLG
ncbi:MAG: YdiY family protein [Vicinamibacteria bacterium]